MSKKIIAYTDASSYNNGKKIPSKPQHSCSSGIFVIDNCIIYGTYNFNPNTTNQYGELYAIYMMLTEFYVMATKSKIYKPPYRLELYSDSAFSVNSINIYIKGWLRKTTKDGIWLNSSNAPVIYQRMFEEIYEIINDDDDFEIKIRHIKGHLDFRSRLDIKKAYTSWGKNNGGQVSIDQLKSHIYFNNICDEYAKDALFNSMKGWIENERTRKRFESFISG